MPRSYKKANKLIIDNKCYYPMVNWSRFVNVLPKHVTFKTLPSIVEVMMT